ncbi:MAG TPA: amidohydrolase [Candidatus Limnocylindrales bacterium]|nr:amidohydrolase [Candidatus Limnocylindrales bacterium]
MPLDTLVTGRIATFAGDTGFGWVEAIGISDGVVAFAGSAVDLETRADPHTRRVELEPSEIAMPGLTDAHLHLTDAALAAGEVDLTGTATLEDGLAKLAETATGLQPDAWVEGAGWDHRRWGRWPTAADLEAVLPGRRVALWSFDHHALWVSHAALALAGIDGRTADPPGGIIRRTPDGEPAGVLLENAIPLVVGRIPRPDDTFIAGAVERLGRSLLALGVVAVHDPGPVAPGDPLGPLDLYGRLADTGDLPVRLHAGIRASGIDAAIERGLASGDLLGADPDGRARMGWLKLFADGTLGSGTAALLEPREGSDHRGVFRSPPDELAGLAAKAAGGRIATQIHAIGDAAVRASLDALGPTVSSVPFMPRLEHVQLCHPDDRTRFAGLGIAASVQPVHLREDAATARRDWGRRAEAWGYAWQTLLDDGAVIAFGTDAPIEPIDPWPGIALAVLRRDPSWGPDAEPFGPHESLTLEAALRANAVAPWTTLRDPLGGRLVPGARADLIVLPAAPQAPEAAAAFASVRPRLVMLGGEVTFER